MATTSLAAWQERRSNLKDLQGQKELRTLCTLMDLGNEGRHAEAMDIVRQRILGTQAAKSQWGSWENEQSGTDEEFVAYGRCANTSDVLRWSVSMYRRTRVNDDAPLSIRLKCTTRSLKLEARPAM